MKLTAQFEHPAVPDARPDAPVTADIFRKAMRGFASTVTIVSTEAGGRFFGMVATAVTSISVVPPLLMVAVQRDASSHDPLHGRGAFCVNILQSDQRELAMSFIADRESRFRVGAWGVTAGASAELSGLPYLPEAQSVFVCSLDEAVPSATHTLFIGRVERIETGAAVAPLVYCAGAFGAFCRHGKNGA